MFLKRKLRGELDLPPLAASDPRAVELLRIWSAPNAGQQLTLRTGWEDPAAWGLLLVDIARHAAQAYEREGHDSATALSRIRQALDAEWSSPTDSPADSSKDP